MNLRSVGKGTEHYFLLPSVETKAPEQKITDENIAITLNSRRGGVIINRVINGDTININLVGKNSQNSSVKPTTIKKKIGNKEYTINLLGVPVKVLENKDNRIVV